MPCLVMQSPSTKLSTLSEVIANIFQVLNHHFQDDAN